MASAPGSGVCDGLSTRADKDLVFGLFFVRLLFRVAPSVLVAASYDRATGVLP